MEKELKFIGKWYLPEHEEIVVSGTLTYIPHETITLELIGDFMEIDNPFEAVLNRPNPETIWGVVYDAETKKKLKRISLLGCHRGCNNHNMSCTFPIAQYKTNYLVIGSHINSIEDNLFCETTAKIDAMNKWCHPAALTGIYPTKNKRINGAGISFNSDEIKEPIITTKVSDSVYVNIGRGVTYSMETALFEASFSQHTTIDMSSDIDLSIIDILKYINHYEQFISFMSLCNVYVDSIYLRNKNQYQELDDGERILDPIELIYINRRRSDVPKNYLVEYKEIEEVYPIMITKWYDLSEDLAPIRNHLIKSLRHKNIFDYSDYVIIAHALEGYYLRVVDSSRKSLELRYNDLYCHFSGLRIFANKQFDAKAAADSRNYYSHFFIKESRHRVLDGIELYKLYIQMRALLICCILELIGLDLETIDRITSSSNNGVFRS